MQNCFVSRILPEWCFRCCVCIYACACLSQFLILCGKFVFSCHQISICTCPCVQCICIKSCLHNTIYKKSPCRSPCKPPLTFTFFSSLQRYLVRYSSHQISTLFFPFFLAGLDCVEKRIAGSRNHMFIKPDKILFLFFYKPIAYLSFYLGILPQK